MMKIDRSKWLYFSLCLYAFSTLLSMAAMSIGAALVVAGLLVQNRKFQITDSAARSYLKWTGFLVAMLALSLIQAWIWPLVVHGETARVHGLADGAKLWYFFWPLLLAFAIQQLTPAQQWSVLKVWMGSAGVLGAVGIAQFFTGWPRPQETVFLPGYYHATLFLGHHLSVASIFIFPFFAALSMTEKRWTKWVAGAVFLCLILTFSRTLWVALPVALGVWLTFLVSKRKLIALLLIGCLGGVVLFQIPSVHRRLTEYRGIGERQDLWEANWEFFKKRPILGVGWRKNAELSGYYLQEKFHRSHVFSGHAHNTYLDTLSGTGALGILAWLAWVGWILAAFWKRRFHRLALGLFCAWVALLINGLTQSNLIEGKVLHQVMFSVAWAIVLQREDARKQVKC